MSKYFKNIEDNMNEDFLAKLDEAREYANIPFIINSAYRSPEHPEDSRTRFLILDALLAVGFNRIGIADTFIHVDSDLDKSQSVIWTY
mgnify:CR=1 FL=1